MRPQESARVARRIASRISHSHNPSREAVAADLGDLVAAIGGDREANLRLMSSLSSGIPAFAQLEKAFVAAGEEAPEMRRLSRGVWIGKFKGVSVAMHAAPDGTVQKMLVASRPVTSFREAVEAAQYFAMADNGTPEDPEDLEAAYEALGFGTFACMKCGGPVKLDSDFACPKCNTEYVTCPGCSLPYPMEANEGDHCPICGYSSWGELPVEVSEPYIAALMEAAKKAAETRQPQPVDYEGFKVTVSIEGNNIKVTGPDGDVSTDTLEDWMARPSDLQGKSLDEFLWSKNSKPIAAPKPYQGKPEDLEVEGGSVQVQGSGKTPYTLMHKGDVYSCSCPAWKIQKLPANKRTCKHLKAFRGADVEAKRVGG